MVMRILNDRSCIKVPSSDWNDMSKKMPSIPYTPIPNGPFIVCGACGSYVIDSDIHNTWHRLIWDAFVALSGGKSQ